MKSIFTAFFIAVAMLGLAACSKVPAGNVGIKVYLLGSSKGVDIEELSPGRYWIGWNQELYIFPTFTQNTGWTMEPNPELDSENDESFTFQSREGMAVSADIGLSYSVRPDSVPIIFQKYRRGIDEITDTYLRNMIQDALVVESSKLPVESVYGEGKADLMAKVEARVRAQVEPIGINIERIYWIGQLRLPNNVMEAINNKLQATQMAQQRRNEVEQAKAEADKLIESARGEAESVLVKAKAQAEANILLAQSISPELVQYRAIEKWDGVVSKVTGGEGMNFLMDISKTFSETSVETQVGSGINSRH